jgi:septal ring factor EnvC (AmiA/AmiB activator)
MLETVRQTLEGVRQMLEGVRQMLETVRQMLETVRQTLETVRQTLETVRQTLEAVRQTLEAVRQTLEAVHPRLNPSPRRHGTTRSLAFCAIACPETCRFDVSLNFMPAHQRHCLERNTRKEEAQTDAVPIHILLSETKAEHPPGRQQFF